MTFLGPSLVPLLPLHGLVTAVAVLFYVVTSHVMHQRRHPAAAIAWMLFILLLPYLALPAYLIYGSRKLEPRPAPTPVPAAAHGADAWAIETIVALGGPAPAACRDLNVHEDGHDARAALLDALDAAQHSIDLCTFMLGRDSLGDAVLDRLCEKARAGVRVRLLLDGVGSLMGGRPKSRRLVAAGGAVALFAPPIHSPLRGATNLRNHRKLVVIDADGDAGRLWCGGRNLATEYFTGRPGRPPWRDLSFEVRGPLVRQAAAVFECDWAFANGRPDDLPAAPAAAPFPADGAQMVTSGPDRQDDTIYSLLVTAAYRARRRIALVTPYFVPEAALLMALCLAARRGVQVDLLLPARSNHRLSDLARARALRSLAQAGGRVWLLPHMEHGKLAVVDDALALAGSANLDTRSLFMNYEVMVAFHRPDDVRRFAAWFERERLPAQRYVATPPGLVRDVAEGMLLWLGFQL